MIQQKEHFHGSDLEKIEQIYGIKKEEITSLASPRCFEKHFQIILTL